MRIREVVIRDNHIELNILGQKFIQKTGTDIPEEITDKEWMKSFGMAMEYLGKVIQRTAEYGEYGEYKDFQENKHITLGFTKKGKVINKQGNLNYDNKQD